MRKFPLLFFHAGGAIPPAYALNESGIITHKNAAGPDNLMGTLASPCDILEDLAYTPETQTWQRVPSPNGQGQLYIGIDNKDRLIPADVERKEIRMGHKVEMGGHTWEIPVVRLLSGGTNLPRRRVLNDDGSRRWEVEEQYRDLCDMAAKAWDWRQGNERMMYDEIDVLCGRALEINYRIGMQEAILLGLFTDKTMLAIVDALLDVPTLMAMADAESKKNGTAGP
jgi:hypothetical protein